MGLKSIVQQMGKSIGNSALGVLNQAGGALGGGVGGVIQQGMFQEYFTSGNMAGDIIMKRAEQVRTNGSRNTGSDNNVISNGSVIDVQHNQCMIIVENGRVVEACMEPGRFVYDTSIAPSFFEGNEGSLGEKAKAVALQMWEQAKMGGQRKNTQRIYFINTGILDKSLNWGAGNIQFQHTESFMTTNGVPLTRGIVMKGHGTARLRLERPIDFFENYGAKFAGGDNNAVVTMDSLETFFTAAKNRVTEAIAMSIQELGDKKPLRYNQIMQASNMKDLRELVNMQMEDTDLSKIGFDFYEFTVGGSGFIISEEDRKAITEMQTLAFQASNMAMGNLRTQQMIAERFGEGQAGGAAAVMMGANAGMGGVGNVQAQPPQQFGQPYGQQGYGQQAYGAAVAPAAPAAPAADSWTCSCGATATGKFCNNCGGKKPEPKPVDGWQCSCGATATGRFCNNCGQPKPEPKPANGWTCSCGNVVEDGMFCSNCGSKKPAPQAAVAGWTCSCGNVVTEGDFCSNCGSRKPEANKPKKFVCDKCGWTSDNINTRFCPKCGDRGTEADIQ